MFSIILAERVSRVGLEIDKTELVTEVRPLEVTHKTKTRVSVCPYNAGKIPTKAARGGKGLSHRVKQIMARKARQQEPEVSGHLHTCSQKAESNECLLLSPFLHSQDLSHGTVPPTVEPL